MREIPLAGSLWVPGCQCEFLQGVHENWSDLLSFHFILSQRGQWRIDKTSGFKKAQLYMCLFCSPPHIWLLTHLEVPNPQSSTTRSVLKIFPKPLSAQTCFERGSFNICLKRRLLFFKHSVALPPLNSF